MTEETTIWTDKETRDKLRRLAEFYHRSMAAQLSWMVEQELDKLDGREAPSGDQAWADDMRRRLAQPQSEA